MLNDPVNHSDPLGLAVTITNPAAYDIIVTAPHLRKPCVTLCYGESAPVAPGLGTPGGGGGSGALKQVCEAAKSANAAFEKGVNLGPEFVAGGAAVGGTLGSVAGPPGALAGAGAGAEAGAVTTALAGMGASGSQFVVDLTTARGAGDVAQGTLRLGVGVFGGKVVEGFGRRALETSYLRSGTQKLIKSFGGAAVDRALNSVDKWLNPETPC